MVELLPTTETLPAPVSTPPLVTAQEYPRPPRHLRLALRRHTVQQPTPLPLPAVAVLTTTSTRYRRYGPRVGAGSLVGGGKAGSVSCRRAPPPSAHARRRVDRLLGP